MAWYSAFWFHCTVCIRKMEYRLPAEHWQKPVSKSRAYGNGLFWLSLWFFEEFLFRGFVQSRIDRQFGWVPAILVSGAMFSLYHLGYPGFRTWEDILLLFAVGAGFAAAYKLSGNNLMVSFFVNLPNAFVTYILKYEQFPVMRVSSTIAAAVTLVLIGLILLLYRNADRRIRRQ